MGSSLTGQQIKNTYKSLIKTSDSTEASATAKLLSDGNGNDFGVYIDTDGVFGIGSAPSYSLDVSSRTDGVALPVGTTANRPTPTNGLLRYNSTIGKIEFYDGGWKTVFTTSGGTISGDVIITGDLTVQGDNTIIEAQTVEVEDNILNLNRTQGSPDTATATTSGISVYRGDGVTEASFIFDDADDTWDLTNSLVVANTLQATTLTDGTATLTGGVLSNVTFADGVTAVTQATSDNSTKIATTAYVKSVVTLEDLDFAGDSGTGSVDLDSQTFTIGGTTNQIETTASGQGLTLAFPIGGVVLPNGSTATTQDIADDSTNIATTAFVKSVVTAEDLDFQGDTGTGSVDLDSQSLTISGTTNEIETSASGQTITIGLPNNVVITGDLTVDTDTLYVDSANNRVGIGLTPSTKLDVNGIIKSNDEIQIHGTPSDSIGAGPNLYFNGGTGSSFTQLSQGVGRFTIWGFNGSSWGEKMTIRHLDGNVGIGTDNPSSKLHLYTDGSTNTELRIEDTQGQAGLRLLAGDGSTNRATRIDFLNKVNSTTVPRWTLLNDYNQDGTNDFRFIKEDGSTSVILLQSGNVGIGTDSPLEPLHLQRDGTTSYATTTIRNVNSTAYLNIGVGGSLVADTPLRDNAYIIVPTAADLLFRTSNAERMRITSAGAIHLSQGTGNSYIGTDAGNLGTSTGTYNTGFGQESLYSNTTGAYNTAIGRAALYYNTTGYSNTALGFASLNSNTTGYYNTANGYVSLFSNTTGYYNTANGYASLYFNTTGHYNTSNGVVSLYNNTTGYSNAAFAAEALLNNTTGYQNTAIGTSALAYNTTGYRNVALGYESLFTNTTGTNNVAIGRAALFSNTTGLQNTALGVTSLYSNTTGNYNTAIGLSSLYYNTTGYQNTASGFSALTSNTTGYNNTANGYGSLLFNTTGYQNTAIGLASLYYNTTGINNAANGYASLYSNTTGYANTALGNSSLYSNTTGYYNTATGDGALYSNTTGYENTAVGLNALIFNTTGVYNTAVGRSASHSTTIGGANVAIGNNSLYSNTTGNSNTTVGVGAGNSITTGSNNTVLGYDAQASSATVSNEITLGNASVTSLRCNTQTISSLSDARDKTNVEDLPLGLDFVDSLRPVKFDWDRRDGTMSGVKDAGFIAQELDEAQSQYGCEDYLGLVYKNNPEKLEASYGKLVPVLVKAIQELKAEVESLKQQIS